MGDEPTTGDNDADKRPRIYMRSSTTEGEVEVTVQGAEGETVADCSDVADERFRHAVRENETLSKGDDDVAGYQ